MTDIDLVRLNFNPQTLFLLNCVLGLVMFGVALDLKPSGFQGGAEDAARAWRSA